METLEESKIDDGTEDGVLEMSEDTFADDLVDERGRGDETSGVDGFEEART